MLITTHSPYILSALNNYIYACAVNKRTGKEISEILNRSEIAVSQHIKVLKEANTSVVTFVRYEVGEGMEKRQENFAEEVMNQING